MVASFPYPRNMTLISSGKSSGTSSALDQAPRRWAWAITRSWIPETGHGQSLQLPACGQEVALSWPFSSTSLLGAYIPTTHVRFLVAVRPFRYARREEGELGEIHNARGPEALSTNASSTFLQAATVVFGSPGQSKGDGRSPTSGVLLRRGNQSSMMRLRRNDP